MKSFIQKVVRLLREDGLEYTLSRVPAFVKWRILELVYVHGWRLTHDPAKSLLGGTDLEAYEEALDTEYIAVLGRGPSLKNVHELGFVDTFIITNEFEMGDETVSNVLRGKRLIQIGNIMQPTLSGQDYYRHNIVNYVMNVTSDDWQKPPYERNRRDRRRPELYGFEPTYLPEELAQFYHDEFPEGTNTVGILSVAFAARMSSADHIFTAGIDFLESGAAGYLSSEDPSEEHLSERQDRSDDLKADMTAIAERFPEKHFHIVTHSSYDPDLSNVHIYRRGIERPSSSS
jgi:hypothetical protein